MAEETGTLDRQNPEDSIIVESEAEEQEYDPKAGEELAQWVWGTVSDDEDKRKEQTRELDWEADRKFLRGTQWEGRMPSYRRPIVMNAWKRALHVQLATALGGRPTLKLVPQGGAKEEDLKVWQDALWANQKSENVFAAPVPDAYSDALVMDGGWLKTGYGSWAPGVEPPDVQVTAPHPGQIFPDGECTDPTLTHCHHISYRFRLDLATISRRYPGPAVAYVKPDGGVSTRWGATPPAWAPKEHVTTISPSGGWSSTQSFRRAQADVVEHWTDDPSTETFLDDELVNLKDLVMAWSSQVLGLSYEEKDRLVGLTLGHRNPTAGYKALMAELNGRVKKRPTMEPEYRQVEKWRYRYPYGRVITCTSDTVLRDVPNPYGRAFGWKNRWPFVYVPGAVESHTVWRPGLLSGMSDLQWAINKSLSLLLENAIKVTNAIMIADDTAIDEDDWDDLQLFPGCKIRKQPGSEVSIVFPQPLPPQAFQLADYFIRKLEEAVGLQDPQLPPGQAVAAKTVAFMQQKGSYLLGIVAKGFDDALERLGLRQMGLMRSFYVPGRMIPFFEGEKIDPRGARPLPQLPPAAQFRVEATSAYQELQATAMVMAQAAEEQRAQRKS